MSSKTAIRRAVTVLGMSALIMVPLIGTADAAVPTLQVRALGVAKYQIGDPYAWGAAGPSAFDCSGLVYYAYKHASNGKTLSRTAQAQYDKSTKIKSTNRKVGDLIFFATGWHWSTHHKTKIATGVYHVGIYMGDGKILHAPHTGAKVRIEKLWTNSVFYGRI